MSLEGIVSDGVRAQLGEFLREEVDAVLSSTERGEYEEELQRIRREREARPDPERRGSWEGSANVATPLSMSKTQVGFASLKQAIARHDPLWEARVVEGVVGLDDHAKSLTRFLKVLAESRDFLNMRRVHNRLLYQVASEGTAVVKVPWVSRRRRYKRLDPGSGGLVERSQIQKIGPQIVVIRNEDFVARSLWSDVQSAPWVGHRFRLATHELMSMGAEGVWDSEAVQEVLESGGMTQVDEGLSEEFRNAGIQVDLAVPDMGMAWEFVESHLFWDIDQDGIVEDVIVTLHPQTGIVVRDDLNEVGRRPFEVVHYVERPDVLQGQGIGHIMEFPQAEADTVHNLRLDAMVINLLKMWVARRGSSIEHDEGVEPGKVWLADDTGDIAPFPTAPVDPASFTVEQLAKMYGDMASGFGDTAGGLADQVLRTRDTFRGQVFRQQQGSKVFFETIADSVAEAYGEIGELIVMQLVLHREEARGMTQMLGPQDRQNVEEILEREADEIPRNFKMTVKVTDLDRTEDAKRQSLLTATQLYAQYAERLIPLVQMLSVPQVQQMPQMFDLLMSVFIGATRMMEETFKDFGIDDPRTFLPSVEQAVMLKEALMEMEAGRIGANRLSAGRAVDGRAARGPQEVGADAGVGSVSPDGAGVAIE